VSRCELDQLNIAVMKESPSMARFGTNLDRINVLAESWAGLLGVAILTAMGWYG
jgi:hypothetical protein